MDAGYVRRGEWCFGDNLAILLMFFTRTALANRNPHPGSVTIADTIVGNATAGAVGGAVAVRAARLVEDPGSRTVDLVRLGVSNCTAKRGGGMTRHWLLLLHES